MHEINYQSTTDIPVWDKICNIFSDEVGKEFTTAEIIDLVVERYPDTNKTSVIPSDYCYNMTNKGIDYKKHKHIFEQLERGHYKVLGTGYDYVGPVFWKGKQL